MTKRVLVTGGTGYLGSVLVPMLLDEGYTVDVFDRLLYGLQPLAQVLEHPRLRLIEGDLARLVQHNGFLEGVDSVIHLAGLSNDPSCDLKPELTQRINYDATLELARRSARAGVRRFLFASSCSVYGSNPSPLVDERSDLHPVSLYAEKKAEAEQALLALPAPGMVISALRMATLYGLSPRMRFDLAINLMVLNAATRGAIFVLGGGQQWRPFLHVVDASHAFLTTLQAPAEFIDREVFNVGADEHNFRIGDLAATVSAALSPMDVSVTTVPDDADRRSYRVSFQKIAERLEYRSRCDLTQSIVEIARAILSGRLGDCTDERFYTVKHMRTIASRPAMAGGDPVRSEFLPFALPLVGREEEEEVLDTLRSGWMTTGPKTKRFEQELAEYAGAKHAIAVNSCTAALHVSLAALGVGRGDEVITSAITFPATANVVIHQGAKPVLVDVDPTTLNIDPAGVERAITPRTKAIIPIHMAGQLADMEAIYAIARRHDLQVIEDAAHGIGAEYRGRRIGNLDGSLAACYSFYPIKNMTTIEGGAILTNDDAFAEQARLWTLHGISKDAWKRYTAAGSPHWDTLLPGFKYNMTDVQAAVGLHQLRRLEGFLQTRQRYVDMYAQAFADLPEIETLRRLSDVRHAWHLFVILLRTELLSVDRDGFVEALKRENIGTGIHFRSLHIQPLYRQRLRLRTGDLPNAATVSERLLSLPLYPKMTERDVLDVIEAVRKLVAAYRIPTNGHAEHHADEMIRTPVSRLILSSPWSISMRAYRLVLALVAIMSLLAGVAPVAAEQPAAPEAAPAADRSVPPGGAPAYGSGPIHFPGYVRVIDGNTVEMYIHGDQVGVQLLGIDVPQGNTPCGRLATAALESLVQSGINLEDDSDPSLAFSTRKLRLYHGKTMDGTPIEDELVKGGVAQGNGRGARRQQLAALTAAARSGGKGCLWKKTASADPLQPMLAAEAPDQGPAAAKAPGRAMPLQTTLPGGFAQDVVAGGFSAPTSFAYLPDGRILVAEKSGIVKVIKNGAVLPTPFIDIRDHVNDYWDHGLLGIAADPNFAVTGYVYLSYTFENDPTQYNAGKTARVTRVTANGDTAAPGSESVILGKWVGQSCQDFPAGYDCIPSENPSHSIGDIKFAADGTMFITTGDAASFNVVDDLALRAQSIDSLAGKMLHVTASGAGVPSNPFWNGDPTAIRSKVWAYGLRNPYRFNLRPTNGTPFLGDVGWGTWEEADVAAPGANFGWPCYEGAFIQSGYEPKATCQALYNLGTSAVTMPLVAWDHTDGNGNILSSASTGGVFYSGDVYPSQYNGTYFYADYAQGWIRTLQADTNDALVADSVAGFGTQADGPVDLEMGPDQNIYYMAINFGELRRIRYVGGGNRPPAPVASATPTNGLAPLNVQFSSAGSNDPDGDPLTYSWDFGDGTPGSSAANPQHTYSSNGAYTATLTLSDNQGGSTPATLKITVGNRAPTATIGAPSASLQYKVGDVISLSGAATDPEDGTLSAASLSWRIIIHHCPGGVCHTHEFLTIPSATGSFTVPDHGDDSHFEAFLTATDSGGLTDTRSVAIHPQTVPVTMTTSPSGLQLVLDGINVVGPHTWNSIVGSAHTFGAPSPQGGATFAGWSDGGGQQHNITVGASGNTYTATFGLGSSPHSVSFNGTTAYAEAPHTPELNITGDWTAETWFKDETPGGFNHDTRFLLNKGDSNTNGESPYQIGIQWGMLFAGGRSAWNNQWVTTSLNGVDASAWHHVAVALNSTTKQLVLYLDGVQVASTSVASVTGTGNRLPLSLGRNGTTGQYWQGKLDDVRIWNVVRTPTQIASSYQAELTGTPTGLVGNWRFNEGSGAAAGDSVTVSQNAALQGSASWSTDLHGAPDTTPPTISAVQATGTSQSAATITWATDEAADSQVEYGPTTSYASSSTLDTARVVAHSVQLGGLTPGTTYHYRVKSRDGAGNLATSADFTFATAAPASCPCSLWAPADAPAVPSGADASAVELGLRFRSDRAGYVTAVRFFKGAANTGAHLGHLWAADGTLLATATFQNESASGWQQAAFPGPVPIRADTTYVVSYLAPNGRYAATPGAFAAAGRDAGPLHALRDGQDGPNGLFLYGPQGGFPTGAYQSSNYWVDLVFATSVAPDTAPPAISAVQATGATSTGATITWTTDEAADSQVEYGPTASYGSSSPPDASLTTSHSVALAGLSPSTTYHYRVKSRDGAGNLATSADFTFATAEAAGCPCSLWAPADAPAVPSGADAAAVELGLRFRSDRAGYVAAVRFFKGAANTGAHLGHLWAADGTLLASATFQGESASGWQQAAFPGPVPIRADTTYVVSYLAPNGRYAATPGAFAAAGRDAGPLHALRDGQDGPNGLYLYGPQGGFPTGAYQSTNYWVDLVFATSVAPDTAPPAISAVQATGATSTGATITWTTDEAADSQVEYGPTASYGSSSTLDPSLALNHSVQLSGLALNTTYHFRVKSRDGAGNLATSADGTFKTLSTSLLSLGLNGTTAYANAPNAAELNVTGDWTVEAWFKDETPGGFNHDTKYIVTKGDSDANGEAPYFIRIEWGSLVAGERTGWSDYVVSAGLGGVSANAWHHVAATMQASTRQLTLYLDGAQVAQGTLAAQSATGNSVPLSIGRNGASGRYWQGKLDDVRIWNVVRTSAQIAANYQAELSGTPPTSLVGNWKFNEGTGTTAADTGGVAQNATLRGSATWSGDTHS